VRLRAQSHARTSIDTQSRGSQRQTGRVFADKGPSNARDAPPQVQCNVDSIELFAGAPKLRPASAAPGPSRPAASSAAVGLLSEGWRGGRGSAVLRGRRGSGGGGRGEGRVSPGAAWGVDHLLSIQAFTPRPQSIPALAVPSPSLAPLPHRATAAPAQHQPCGALLGLMPNARACQPVGRRSHVQLPAATPLRRAPVCEPPLLMISPSRSIREP
jgi:hypothetical protein